MRGNHSSSSGVAAKKKKSSSSPPTMNTNGNEHRPPSRSPFPMNLVASCRGGPKRSSRGHSSSVPIGSRGSGGGGGIISCGGGGGGGTRTNHRLSSTNDMTAIASQEELERYAITQELLSLAQSADEASHVSKLSHSDSIEALAVLTAGERLGSSSQQSLESSGILPNNNNDVNNPKRKSFRRGFRKQRSHNKLFGKIGHALKGIEKAVFPHKPELGSASMRFNKGQPTMSVIPKVPGGVLLHGCTDDEEHMEVVRQSITIMKTLTGKAGLTAMGLEYRSMNVLDNNQRIAGVQKSTGITMPKSQHLPPPPSPSSSGEEEQGGEKKKDCPEVNNAFLPPNTVTTPTFPETTCCEDTMDVMTQLFHVETNTLITMKNRKEFIADGDMYDQVARLCQEYAQEVMIDEGELEWVTVCEAGNNPEPIRALVSSALVRNEDILDTSPTLLIATGNGKVRAGIFSRQHLITTGMECSTAIPIIREAKKRNMNCVLLDPNVHGDRLGMITFEKSMAKVFHRLEQNQQHPHQDTNRPPLSKSDIYVLSHSQSGAQFARYLLDKSNLYVPHIRAVAFTDSTHNIQWTRDKNDLHLLLQSNRSVYFKVAKDSPKDHSSLLKPLKTTGMIVDTDHFWKHRFGSLVTRCAGTTEHSLTNWFARHHIWNHFDSFLHEGNQNGTVNPL